MREVVVVFYGCSAEWPTLKVFAISKGLNALCVVYVSDVDSYMLQ